MRRTVADLVALLLTTPQDAVVRFHDSELGWVDEFDVTFATEPYAVGLWGAGDTDPVPVEPPLVAANVDTPSVELPPA